jgi:multicomponent Na+:H+ antiporter subunit F
VNLFAVAALALLGVVTVTLLQAVRGPTLFDSFLAASMSGTTAAFAMLLVGFWFERANMFIDLGLAYVLLNFIGTLAAGKFLEKRQGSA